MNRDADSDDNGTRAEANRAQGRKVLALNRHDSNHLTPPAPGHAHAGQIAYTQRLHRALSMKENILITLSAVTPASSVFIIVPTVLLGIGRGSVLTMLSGGLAAFFVAGELEGELERDAAGATTLGYVVLAVGEKSPSMFILH